MKQSISITSIGSISALGTSLEEVWANYKKKGHLFEKERFNDQEEWISPINADTKPELEKLRKSDAKYRKLDKTVLYAIYASRKAIANAAWKANDNFGVNIGSSRGATALFETYHSEYLKNNKAATLASPTTTLGNISSWVAHDLNTKGPEISHSITCSTALHALLNGVAWLQAGMADKFLVGGSEAPLTTFTIAQMKALKIYAKMSPRALRLRSEQAPSRGFLNDDYPCQALSLDKKENTMVLGEGAAVVCLEKGNVKNALAQIIGLGYATEILAHNISISSDAQCFQRSMKMAMGEFNPKDVDIIVMHAPGTIKGDQSEYAAIKKVFGTQPPALTTNKWKVGHTFAASGMLSIELAILMLKHQEFIGVPFEKKSIPKKINKILVNAVGFGGNAVSVLLSKS